MYHAVNGDGPRVCEQLVRTGLKAIFHRQTPPSDQSFQSYCTPRGYIQDHLRRGSNMVKKDVSLPDLCTRVSAASESSWHSSVPAPRPLWGSRCSRMRTTSPPRHSTRRRASPAGDREGRNDAGGGPLRCGRRDGCGVRPSERALRCGIALITVNYISRNQTQAFFRRAGWNLYSQ